MRQTPLSTRANYFFKNREFNKGISFFEKLLLTKKGQEKKGKIFAILGWLYDQAAITSGNEKTRKSMQTKALAFFDLLGRYDFVESFRGKATVFLHQGKFKESLYWYGRALKTKQKKVEIINDIGNIYQKLWLKNSNAYYKRKSIEFYTNALLYARRKRNDYLIVTPLINLSLIYMKSGDRKVARSYAHKVLKIICTEKTKYNYIPKGLLDVLKEIIDEG